MNDKRMDRLVRMAMEAEEMEFGPAARSGEIAPMLRLVGVGDERDNGGAGARRTAWWIGAGVLAAAGIALASVLPMMLGPAAEKRVPVASHGGAPVEVADGAAKPTRGAPVFRRHRSLEAVAEGGGGTTPVWMVSEYALAREPDICVPPFSGVPALSGDRVDPGSVQRCVVVAIYRDDHGSMHCAQVQPQVWPGNKCLSEVTPQEIRTVPLAEACSPTASRTLVVAMAGPQRALPNTELEAIGVARCILGGEVSHAGCAEDLRCIANAAAACVSPEVAVKVESVARR
ncbi:MAG TPA: hypothetical protein PKE29_09590 [Phycisphaerales bacterium]|nr:hypothetical protein [Phycisphaerales bacterium]